MIVAKHIDQSVPTGMQSHRDLLLQMTKRNRQRDNVISIETAKKLAAYLGFRHFYRHSYSFFIDWNELQKLVHRLSAVWAQTKSDGVIFTNSLRPGGYAGNSLE